MSQPESIARYRKLPVEIEAVHLTNDVTPDAVAAWCGGRVAPHPEKIYTGGPLVIEIDTLEGTMRAEPGDWIIKGVQGEFYPCKPDIFAATYAAAVPVAASPPATNQTEAPAAGPPAFEATQTSEIAPKADSKPTDWIDGHPQLEAIAAAVWEHCERHAGGGSGLVVDDPRNIAVAALAVLPATPGRADTLLWAADFAETVAEKLRAHHEFERSNGALDVMTELRRLANTAPAAGLLGEAGETQQDQRTRCPDCQMPHDLTPEMAAVCASIRASVARQPAVVAQPDKEPTPCSQPNPCEGDDPCATHERERSHIENDHSLCDPADCEVLRQS